MKHYINKNKEIFAFELDGSQDHLIKENMVEIAFDEINAINQVKAQEAFDALSYAEKRASKYPPITDYIDGIVKGDSAQVQNYIDKCLAIKAKYPKE